MPGNGSPKPDGSSVQAVYCAPKYVEWWSEGESCEAGESRRRAVVRKATVLEAQRQVSRTPPGSQTRAWRQGGNLETWESQESPCGASGVGMPPVGGKTPGVERTLPPLTRPCSVHRDTKQEEGGKVSGVEREYRTHPRRALGSRSRSSYRRLEARRTRSSRWGTAVPGTHCRAGEAGHNALWRALWERRRAHQPSPCNSRGLRNRHNALRTWCSTTCFTCLTVTVFGKPLVSPGRTVRQGGTRERRNKTPQTWTTPSGTCPRGVATIGMSRRRSNGYGSRRQGGSRGQ